MEQTLDKIANYLHIFAVLGLLIRIWWSRNCSGISGKAQLLYALTHVARHLDLFATFTTIENAIIKIAFILMGYLTIMSIYVFFRDTREREHDTFRIELIVLPCLVAAVYINKGDSTFVGLSYNFCLYLEAFAAIPQFRLIAKAGRVRRSVLYYISALLIYKVVSNLHCLEYEYDSVAIACGIVQALFYCDFFIQTLPNLNGKAIDSRPSEQQVATIDTVKRAESTSAHAAAGHSTDNARPVVLFTEVFIDTSDKVNSTNGEGAREKY